MPPPTPKPDDDLEAINNPTVTTSDNHNESADEISSDEAASPYSAFNFKDFPDLPRERHPDPSGKCYVSCSRKRSDRNMIRCQSCMIWAHCLCVGEKADYIGVWVCHFCRLSSYRVAKISLDIHSLNMKYSNLEKKYNDVSSELQALTKTNTDLVQQVQKLQHENHQLKSKNSTPFPKNKSLIIGDSISRDIEPQDSTQLEVKSISGATMSMVKTTLESLETDNKKFDNIYLVVGSNDCANAQKTSQSITASAKELFDQSKKLSPNVVFSSIIPRTDDPNAHLKSDSVNQSIKRLCSQFNIKFVDNNGSFLTADRSTNDALLLDGLHLNDKGTQKLISNLGVRAAPRKRGTVRQNPSNQNNIQAVRRNVPSLMSTNWNKPYSQNNSFRQTEFNRPQRFPSQHQTWNSSIPNYYPTTNNQWNPPATQWNQQPSFNPSRFCSSCQQPGHSSQNCFLGNNYNYSYPI